ncbi:MAG TPA: restriction endonuclease subunit S [Flavobacteriales bacterium]|nr:restriction endonuclease subunit S [Flavobacteriales bacterium]
MMEDELPYDLPQGWRRERIGNLVLKAKQRDPRKAPHERFAYVDVSSVSNESFKITESASLVGKDAPSRARKEIRRDDVLFATVRPTLRRVALVPEKLDGQIASTGYCVLRSDRSKVDPRYLYSFLLTDGFIARMAGLERGAGYPAVRESDVFGSELPLPPLAEQQRIAQVLSTVQSAIEQQERLIRTTTELKQALMQKLFTEGLRGEAQKETEIGLVPESWEVVPLQSVCELVIDCPHTTPKFLTTGVRVARNFNIRDGRFVPEPAFFTSEEQYRDRVRRAVPEPGDVLFSREAPVGEACVIPEGMRLSLGQRTMLIRTDRSRLSPEFLVYSFYSPVLSKHMKSIASGLTVAHLNVADVRSMPLPLPGLDVQNGITDALLAIERKGEHHRTKLTSLQDLFRTLLHELMTGKVRVPKEVTYYTSVRA